MSFIDIVPGLVVFIPSTLKIVILLMLLMKVVQAYFRGTPRYETYYFLKYVLSSIANMAMLMSCVHFNAGSTIFKWSEALQMVYSINLLYANSQLIQMCIKNVHVIRSREKLIGLIMFTIAAASSLIPMLIQAGHSTTQTISITSDLLTWIQEFFVFPSTPALSVMFIMVIWLLTTILLKIYFKGIVKEFVVTKREYYTLFVFICFNMMLMLFSRISVSICGLSDTCSSVITFMIYVLTTSFDINISLYCYNHIAKDNYFSGEDIKNGLYY